MLFIFRVIFVVIYCIVVCVLGCLYCLFSPRNPKHVATFGHLFGRLSPVFGLKVELRNPPTRKAMATRSTSLTTRTTMIW